MWQATAYCGLPPVPASLAGRFNPDPILILGLLAISGAHLLWLHRCGKGVAAPLAGWMTVSIALLSPLCALAVALFSARVAQHMILLIIAAPLVASGLPGGHGRGLWPAAMSFMIALWLWHMPAPYDATFHSTPLYWSMHVTLFGSGVWLWRELLAHADDDAINALIAGIATSMQMSLLGALLTLSGHAWFDVHYLATTAWGLTPLADQQLGGALMWVPGCALFFWAALRTMLRVWQATERRMPA